MKINTGMRALVPGRFTVPQNPITAPLSSLSGLGDFVPALFTVPQNPIEDAQVFMAIQAAAQEAKQKQKGVGYLKLFGKDLVYPTNLQEYNNYYPDAGPIWQSSLFENHQIGFRGLGCASCGGTCTGCDNNKPNEVLCGNYSGFTGLGMLTPRSGLGTINFTSVTSALGGAVSTAEGAFSGLMNTTLFGIPTLYLLGGGVLALMFLGGRGKTNRQLYREALRKEKAKLRAEYPTRYSRFRRAASAY